MTATTFFPIKIFAHRHAFVALRGGKELGTVAKLDRASAWTVYEGTGMTAKFVTTCQSKQVAMKTLIETVGE